MRAVAVVEPGRQPELIELPTPEAADDELLVRVHASSINPVDVLTGRAEYRRADYELPVVLGWDFAGTVERVGSEAAGFEPGDEVFGYWQRPRASRGAWAEYLALPAGGFVARRPPGISPCEAAALALAGNTALLAVEGARPGAGETVLVTGGGGAVGAYVVQFAAMRGAHVIATAKTGDQGRMIALGATEAIDYTREDVGATVRARHPGGLSVLIDIVNDRDAVGQLGLLVRDGGRVVSARFAADAPAFGERGIAVANVAADRCDTSVLERLVELAETGALRIAVDEVRPLEDAPVALGDFARGGRGKIVIAVAGE